MKGYWEESKRQNLFIRCKNIWQKEEQIRSISTAFLNLVIRTISPIKLFLRYIFDKLVLND